MKLTRLVAGRMHTKGKYLETEYHEHTKQPKVKSSLRIMRSEDEKLLRFIDLIDLVIEKL